MNKKMYFATAFLGLVMLVGAGCVTKDVTLYSNDVLQLTFSYPKEWGDISSASKQNATDPSQVDLKAFDKIFMVAAIPGRDVDSGGWWGKYAFALTEQNSISNFCKEPFGFTERIKNCTILTNNNRVTYAKTQEEICTEGGCSGIATNYYFYNPNSEFHGIVISSDRLRDNGILQLDEKLDALVQSFNFISEKK